MLYVHLFRMKLYPVGLDASSLQRRSIRGTTALRKGFRLPLVACSLQAFGSMWLTQTTKRLNRSESGDSGLSIG